MLLAELDKCGAAFYSRAARLCVSCDLVQGLDRLTHRSHTIVEVLAGSPLGMWVKPFKIARVD
jgi:hypothetical protein